MRFRVVWTELDSVPGKSGVKYKTRLETIELKCAQRRFRRYGYDVARCRRQARLLGHWQTNRGVGKHRKTKSLMSRVFDPACALLDEKRHKPAVESAP